MQLHLDLWREVAKQVGCLRFCHEFSSTYASTEKSSRHQEKGVYVS